MDDEDFASPACALGQAPDAYRGYLAPAEIAARLSGMAAALRGTGRADLAECLEILGRNLPEAGPTPEISDVAAAFDQLLPRIADDRLHAAIAALRVAL